MTVLCTVFAGGCAETLTLDDKYLDKSDGLISQLEKTIFDPLIAVFVNKPNIWSSASWAWASLLYWTCLRQLFIVHQIRNNKYIRGPLSNWLRI